MKEIHNYILDERGEPIVEPDLMKWAKWFQVSNDKRLVKLEKVADGEVSTVFLGIDHNFSGAGEPVLWETMIFGGANDQYQDRCSGSREQAEAMHARAVQFLKDKPKRKITL
jgi:hypothetical protein